MTYLASAYSHPDAAVRTTRYRAACWAAATMMRAGLLVFSPIAHSHPLTEYGLPGGWEFWRAFDERMINSCDEVRVLMLDGWQESRGISEEVKIAHRLGKPVWYVMPAEPLTCLSESQLAKLDVQ